MTRYTLTVPLQDNEGYSVPQHTLDYVRDRLVDIAGGVTITDGEGSWRGDRGRIFTEPVRIFTTDNAEDIIPNLTGLAQWLAEALGQEAIYLTAQDIATFLVEPVTAS